MFAILIPILMFSAPSLALDKNEGIILRAVITNLTSTQPLDDFGNPDSGIVWVNNLTNTVHVDLYADPCRHLLPPREGYIGCLALSIPKMTASFTAPLQQVIDRTCGRKLYRGTATDKFVTPDGEVSGNYDIEISDNQRFGETCKSYLPMPPVSGFLRIRVDGQPENEVAFSAVLAEEDDTIEK